MSVTEIHDGHFCQTEIAHHMTVPPGVPLPGILIEEDASVTMHRGRRRADTSVNEDVTDAHRNGLEASKGEPVKCACDEFDCVCKKQCFCKTQSEPFPITQPSRCPTCKTCNGRAPPPANPPEGDDADEDADKPAPAPHEFKCTCSFDGAGGKKMGSKNAMDCDCKVTDCQCTRKCKCRAGGE